MRRAERTKVRMWWSRSGGESATMGFMVIDVSFDFRTDANGADPDAASPTLLRYHQLLWSKPLPSGQMLELTPRTRKPHALLHESDLGSFLLTSDSVLPTFTGRTEMRDMVASLPAADIDALKTITYTIGGMILWPGNQINRKWTINQARGCTGRIADRFDLTIECVRRHYAGDTAHPLADAFGRYRDFFDLFDTFAGYISFWHLDDLIDPAGHVKLFHPSDDFTLPALPRTLDDYLAYCERTIEFVAARNARIHQLGL